MKRPLVFTLLAIVIIVTFVAVPIGGWFSRNQVVTVSDGETLRCAEPNDAFVDDGTVIVPLGSDLNCELVFSIVNTGFLPVTLDALEIPWTGSQGSNMMHAITINGVATVDGDSLKNDALLEFDEPLELAGGDTRTFNVTLQYIPDICTMQGGDGGAWQIPPGPRYTVSALFGTNTFDYTGRAYGFASTDESSLCGPGYR